MGLETREKQEGGSEGPPPQKAVRDQCFRMLNDGG